MAITIGAAVTNRSNSYSAISTKIDKTSPAAATGIITQFEIWAVSALSGCKMGTFSGSGTSYTNRASATIGAVASGSKQTFSGLYVSVASGDFIGEYHTSGALEFDTSGGPSVYACAGDQFGTGVQTYSDAGAQVISMQGTGLEFPAGVKTINSLSLISVKNIGNLGLTGAKTINGLV